MGKRVLFVDDEPVILEAAEEILAAKDLNPDLYEDSQGVLQDLEEGVLQRPDIAVIDWQLPGLNGYELYQILVESLGPFPVIFISGDRPDIMNQLETQKHIQFVGKPFRFQALIAQINEHAPNNTARS